MCRRYINTDTLSDERTVCMYKTSLGACIFVQDLVIVVMGSIRWSVSVNLFTIVLASMLSPEHAALSSLLCSIPSVDVGVVNVQYRDDVMPSQFKEVCIIQTAPGVECIAIS